MNIFVVILLITAGIALICTELLVPGVILGIIGTISLIIGLVGAFSFGTTAGILTFIAVFIFTATIIKFLLKNLPNTKLGKGMIIQGSLDRSGAVTVDISVGEEGIAQTKLRPSGTAIIRDRRVDVVTEGTMIANGTKVKVVKVEGNRVTVREVTA